MTPIPIRTFIINLKKRIDRKNHILKEFADRDEFAIEVVEPLPHKIGAVSLWITMRSIIKDLTKETDGYILICEDDHQFTELYKKDLLFTCIQEASLKGADLLSGGVHWFSSGLQVTNNLLWIDHFTATQFIIVFRPFFKTIIEADFNENVMADHQISLLTDRIFCISPFISIQKDFGYSDATSKNNEHGIMKNLFAKSSAAAQMLNEVSTFYKDKAPNQSIQNSFENITIATYIINRSGAAEGNGNIKKQFAGKDEFDIIIVEAVQHEKIAAGLWLSIREIIKNAIANEDDVIVICDDELRFTENYSKDYLLKNIIEAHEQGAEILLGGVGSFGLAVPITDSRVWVNHFYQAPFIILYKTVFQKILNEPFDDNIKADFALSYCTSNKMMLFPFISAQSNFTQNDFLSMRDENNELIESLLEMADTKLQKIFAAVNTYHRSQQIREKPLINNE